MEVVVSFRYLCIAIIQSKYKRYSWSVLDTVVASITIGPRFKSRHRLSIYLRSVIRKEHQEKGKEWCYETTIKQSAHGNITNISCKYDQCHQIAILFLQYLVICNNTIQICPKAYKNCLNNFYYDIPP